MPAGSPDIFTAFDESPDPKAAEVTFFEDIKNILNSHKKPRKPHTSPAADISLRLAKDPNQIPHQMKDALEFDINNNPMETDDSEIPIEAEGDNVLSSSFTVQDCQMPVVSFIPVEEPCTPSPIVKFKSSRKKKKLIVDKSIELSGDVVKKKYELLRSPVNRCPADVSVQREFTQGQSRELWFVRSARNQAVDRAL